MSRVWNVKAAILQPWPRLSHCRHRQNLQYSFAVLEFRAFYGPECAIGFLKMVPNSSKSVQMDSESSKSLQKRSTLRDRAQKSTRALPNCVFQEASIVLEWVPSALLHVEWARFRFRHINLVTLTHAVLETRAFYDYKYAIVLLKTLQNTSKPVQMRSKCLKFGQKRTQKSSRALVWTHRNSNHDFYLCPDLREHFSRAFRDF